MLPINRCCTGQRDDLELILTVKMETKHLVEGSLGNEFSSIYNHCGVMDVWSLRRKKINFSFFWTNDHLRKNFHNSVPKRFIATPINVLSSNFMKSAWQEVDKVVRYLPDKKQHVAWLSSSRYCADRAQNLPRPAQVMYSECSRFHPNPFT